MNNYFESISRAEYDSKRTEDPDLSPAGMKGAEKLRDFFKLHGIHFEQCEWICGANPRIVFSSPHVRCLMTTRVLSESAEDKPVPVEVKVGIHEFGGCNLNGKGMSGRPRSFVCFEAGFSQD